MVEFVPFDPVHLDFFRPHPDFAEQVARESPQALAQSREAWSLVDMERGEVLAVFGAMETYNGVFYLWGYLSQDGGAHLLRLTRFFVRWVDMLGGVRKECTVLKNWKCGHRWMRLLKFKRETARPMKLWDGFSDFHLYAKVRP
jgi:hypothetical protein